MTTIYLVRHAEAEGNLCRRIHGHFDTNVTPNGMRQLMDLERRFSSTHVDQCYCSDLTRTRTTAQAVCRPNHLTAIADPAFREVFLGSWEDVPFGALYTHCPQSIHQFSNEPRDWQTEGSETFEQYTGRFLRKMNQIVAAHQGEALAIVTHGAVLRGVLSALFPEVEMRHADNTAVTCLTWEAGRYTLQYLNDNSHLQQGTSLFASQRWWKSKTAGNDGTIWFRKAPVQAAGSAQLRYNAFLGEQPIGYLELAEEGQNSRVTDLWIDPEDRGRAFAIQLLGQAVFVSRRLGKQALLVKLPEHNLPMQQLLKKLFFEPADHGDFRLNLTVRVLPLPEQP